MVSRSKDTDLPRAYPGSAPPARKPPAEAPPEVWAERADLSEAAILTRHLRSLWGLPGTALGVVSWPPTCRERLWLTWHYWWQAHLLDCALDAAQRAPTPARRKRVKAIIRAHRIRNITGWTNNYYDDMAWLALATDRAARTQGLARARRARDGLVQRLHSAWDPDAGGGIPWRVDSDYFNAPANGPSGIALHRCGRIERAQEISDWIHATLRDPRTGLIFDGMHLPTGELEKPIFAYCQGVVLGLETELAAATGDSKHLARVNRLIAAVSHHLTTRGVFTGGGAGDGGLFQGILARYLALVVQRLPGTGDTQMANRRVASFIVRASAASAWSNRLEIEGEPLYGRNVRQIAQLPGRYAGQSASPGVSAQGPDRDLSVQLSGWMLMEAAYRVSTIHTPKPVPQWLVEWENEEKAKRRKTN